MFFVSVQLSVNIHVLNTPPSVLTLSNIIILVLLLGQLFTKQGQTEDGSLF